MPSRSIETTVTFANPFAIGNTTGPKPAGTYRVVVDEDEIMGISFLAYHRVATLFHTPAIGTFGSQQVFDVDREDLDAALAADGEDRPRIHADNF
ncbi:hypothetical protein [Aureimonas leprariae]|uniref:Uncharacterized protein n=1 Tax=Plantimonas leprariae TaxID=2615207 RepID=A0A7V7PSH6_9HYPH|nr:hypothetical protein [Aureimonas leprariae]KAB0682070.1 hypothetical protein F6X38_04530 [Aureimonas leprariae]